MKIAIEGMDGVGKTTIAQELAKRNNFTYIGNAIHQLFGITDKESPYYQTFSKMEQKKMKMNLINYMLMDVSNYCHYLI